MSVTKKEILQRVSQFLTGHRKIVFSYLFGSYVTKLQNEMSDIDLAVYVGGEFSLIEQGSLISRLEILTGCDVDLVILNQSPLLLRFQVVREGRLLYSRDERARIQFEARVMSLYFDQQYYFERRARATFERIAREGIL